MPTDNSPAIDENFVRRWDEALLRHLDSEDPEYLPRPVVENRTVLRPGASSDAIRRAEHRLGVTFPPSYLQFLSITDGAFADALGVRPGRWSPDGPFWDQGIGLLPAEELEPGPPLYAGEWASEPLDGHVDPNYRSRLPEWAYLNYSLEQDPVQFKTGHYRHGIAVSIGSDGWEILLNPMIRQPDGEYEAWDFGPKYPGTYRFRSFRDLLQRQIDNPPEYSIGPSPDVDIARALETLDDPDADLEQRQAAIHQLWLSGLGGEHHPRFREEALRLALDSSVDRYIRGNQTRNLAMARDVDALLHLIDDPEPLIRNAALPPLVASDDPHVRDRVLAALSRPDLDASAVRSLWSDPNGVAWSAYQGTGNLALLGFSSRQDNYEAQRELVTVLADSELSHVEKLELARWPWHLDKRLAEDLEAASRSPNAPLGQIGKLLTPIDESRAIAVWRRVFQESDERYLTMDAAWHLAEIGSEEALDVIVEGLETEVPYPSAVVNALARFRSPRAVGAVARMMGDEILLLSCIYALETQGIPEAREVLANGDHVQSWRALARLGETDAFAPLLAASRSDDEELRREGLEGLRDLNDLRAFERMVEVVESSEPESDEAAIAAHTLAVMDPPSAVPHLEGLLERSDNRSMENVVSDWLSRIGRS